MHRWLLIFGLILTPAALANPYASPAPAEAAEDPFTWELSTLQLEPGKSGVLELHLHVPPGHTVYRDQLEVQVLDAGGLTAGDPSYPPGRVRQDPANGTETRELYDRDVIVHLPLTAQCTASGLVRLELRTRHQGCHGRLCHPPLELDHSVFVRVAPAD